jgi:hypothetical protein
MKKVYLQLEFMTGKVFEYSKEPQEGYVAFTSKTGKVSYRKYHQGITGELDSVSIRDTNFGQELSVTLKTEDAAMYLNFALKDQKDFVDSSYAEDLISKLPNMEKGRTYTINPYRFTPEGDKYDKTGVSIKQGDLKIEKAFTNSYINKEGVKVEGDIPAVVWKKDATGKNKPSAASKEARSDMFLEILATQAERLKWTSSNTTGYASTTPAQETKATAISATASTFEDQELPF